MDSYDISEKNTTPSDEHLKNTHKLEKKMEHDKKDESGQGPVCT
jgi:hypothetical protein